MEPNINYIIEEAKLTALKSIFHFIELLGYDSNNYKHLSECEIKIGENTQYNIETNEIELSKEAIDDLLYILKDDKSKKELVVLNIAVSIVHEIIHKNRDLIIENEINARTFEDKIIKEYFDINAAVNNYDINQLRQNLEQALKLPNIDEFTEIIPVQCLFTEDGIKVIAYDTETNFFIEVNDINVNSDLNPETLLLELSNTIEEGLQSKTIKAKIITKDNVDTEAKNTLANSYIPSTKEVYSRIVANKKMDKKELLTKFEFRKEIILRRLQANGFEEILTEALATMIVLARNKETFNLDEIANETKEIFKEDTVLNIGVQFIEDLGIEMLKWFVTSVYEEVYYDYFQKLFDDNYDELLLNFQKIYESELNMEEPKKYNIARIKSIVRSKIKK